MLTSVLSGVVDENLIVYGTKNLRVVDASVMPMLITAHLQETIYGIAEKVALSIRNTGCMADLCFRLLI